MSIVHPSEFYYFVCNIVSDKIETMNKTYLHVMKTHTYYNLVKGIGRTKTYKFEVSSISITTS